MKALIVAGIMLLFATRSGFSAPSSLCTPKRVKVKQVCGLVVDGLGLPIKGAIVHVQLPDGKQVSREVWTGADGRFVLPDTPQGEAVLAVVVTGYEHNSWSMRRVLTWPLKVTETQSGACNKPLTVHMAGCRGCSSCDWVEQK